MRVGCATEVYLYVPGELGVSAQTASRWYARWLRGGTAGMRTARHGKPAQLGAAELAKIRRVLDRGAVAAGFDNDLLEGAYDTRQFIRVLDGLGHQLGHQPVTVIWDNLRAGAGPCRGAGGQPQRLRVGQPLLRRPHRADRHRPGRLDPRAS